MDIGLARVLRLGTPVVVRLIRPGCPGASVEVDGLVVRAEIRCEVGPVVLLVDFPGYAAMEFPREDVRLLLED